MNTHTHTEYVGYGMSDLKLFLLSTLITPSLRFKPIQLHYVYLDDFFTEHTESLHMGVKALPKAKAAMLPVT